MNSEVVLQESIFLDGSAGSRIQDDIKIIQEHFGSEFIWVGGVENVSDLGDWWS